MKKTTSGKSVFGGARASGSSTKLSRFSPRESENLFLVRGRISTENIKYKPDVESRVEPSFHVRKSLSSRIKRRLSGRRSLKTTPKTVKNNSQKHKSLRNRITSKLLNSLKQSYHIENINEPVADELPLDESADRELVRSFSSVKRGSLNRRDSLSLSVSPQVHRRSLHRVGTKEHDVVLVSATPERVIDEHRRKENFQVQNSVVNASSFEEVDPVSKSSFGRLTSNYLDLKLKLNEEFQKALAQKNIVALGKAEDQEDDVCSEDSFIDMRESRATDLVEKLRSQKEKLEESEEDRFVKAEILQTLEELNSLNISNRSSSNPNMKRTMTNPNLNQELVKQAMHNSFKKKKSQIFRQKKMEEFDNEFLTPNKLTLERKIQKASRMPSKKRSMTIDVDGRVARKTERPLSKRASSSAFKLFGSMGKRLSKSLTPRKCLGAKSMQDALEREEINIDDIELLRHYISNEEEKPNKIGVEPESDQLVKLESVVESRSRMFDAAGQRRVSKYTRSRKALHEFSVPSTGSTNTFAPPPVPIEFDSDLEDEKTVAEIVDRKDGKKLRLHSMRKKVSYKERKTSAGKKDEDKEADVSDSDSVDSLVQVPEELESESDGDENRSRSGTIEVELETEKIEDSEKQNVLLYL